MIIVATAKCEKYGLIFQAPINNNAIIKKNNSLKFHPNSEPKKDFF